MTRRLPPDDFVNTDDLDPADDDSDALESLANAIKRPKPSADPAVWLASTNMTQTEVALRLARHLLAASLVASDVAVSLTGYELTHNDRPRFPVERFSPSVA